MVSNEAVLSLYENVSEPVAKPSKDNVALCVTVRAWRTQSAGYDAPVSVAQTYRYYPLCGTTKSRTHYVTRSRVRRLVVVILT